MTSLAGNANVSLAIGTHCSVECTLNSCPITNGTNLTCTGTEGSYTTTTNILCITTNALCTIITEITVNTVLYGLDSDAIAIPAGSSEVL